MKYPEYKTAANYPAIADSVLKFWKENKVFEQSLAKESPKGSFTFYEGPPSANGTPGIHHVMARTIKDIFCRYKTMDGYLVNRKGGWDTHGLPVELQVEKELGITKDDIGKKISIEEYNQKCRETVMKYKDQWDDLTEKMGYWVDLKNPYITFENNYIESCWSLLKQMYDKKLLYKGYTIQPYSPAAGTGLSSHELNQPGCYRDVKDTSIVAQFKVKRNAYSEKLFKNLGNSAKPFSHRELLKSINDPEVTDTVTNIKWEDVYILAWTTTPWTLPSNAALAVGEKITYVKVMTYNPYTFKPVVVIMAKDLLGKYFHPKSAEIGLETYNAGDKIIPYELMEEYTGLQLVGIEYEQLMKSPTQTLPEGEGLKSEQEFRDLGAFRVITGDFVSTEDGTGIVHIAPTFGADDFRVAKQAGIPAITVTDENDKEMPLVDKKGRFVPQMGEYAGMYVKNYEGKDESDPTYKSTDVLISIQLKTENKAFKVEKYEHSYPHCWRTDKPVLYYPLDSWFIKTTAVKDKMVEYNKTINWKPESTGTGRFGNWLENLVDWNLSRSRYWGTPLPIWKSKRSFIDLNLPDEICIGSIDELKSDGWYYFGNSFENFLIDIKNKSGIGFEKYKSKLEDLIQNPDFINPYSTIADFKEHYEIAFQKAQTPEDLNNNGIHYSIYIDFLNPAHELKFEDLHKHFVDKLVFIQKLNSEKSFTHKDEFGHSRISALIYSREPDLIDVWFDSGAMPYAQWHFPFENKDIFNANYPADFISEGVDQTRGWFFTLHAIAVLMNHVDPKTYTGIAFKNVVSTGLVLDKNGEKMSKRKGNVINPFETLTTYGADATRWYMISNSNPWDNLKFDLNGIGEVQRKFFGTLHNTYNFFALYANLDNYASGGYSPELEMFSGTLTEADRWILSKLNTLIDQVANAYDQYEPTKAARAITDFVCDDMSNWYVRLNRKRFWLAKLGDDKIAAYSTLHTCLTTICQLAAPIAPFYMEELYRNLTINKTSVHLSSFPVADIQLIDKDLEEKMELAQKITSLVHSIRKNNNLRVRLPLKKVMIPILNSKTKAQVSSIADLIMTEVNVKGIEYIEDTSGIVKKKVKPNFQTLGKTYGKFLKDISAKIAELSQEEISAIEKGKTWEFTAQDSPISITKDDLLITTEDIPGWAVASEGEITVALDIIITEDLKKEGIARDFVNRVQNIRKDSGFEVSDKIRIYVEKKDELINSALLSNKEYICTETQATLLSIEDVLNGGQAVDMDEFELNVKVEK